MNNKYYSETILDSRQLVLNSINDPEIQKYVNQYGYIPEKLAEGEKLIDEAEEMNNNQTVQYGEQYSCTQRLHEVMEPFDKTFGMHRALARAVFDNEAGVWEMLGLNGRRKAAQSVWLLNARSFYSNIKAQPEILERMQPMGFTEEVLDARLGDLDDIENLMHERAREMGEAQQATVDRDKKMDELEKWINIYKSVARLALAEKPQLLEKLGLLVRSN